MRMKLHITEGYKIGTFKSDSPQIGLTRRVISTLYKRYEMIVINIRPSGMIQL